MSEALGVQSTFTRVKVLGLALGFVVVSVACRFVLWEALSFLGDAKSIVRNMAIGVLLLSSVVALTVIALRWRPALPHDDLTLLPSASFRSLRLAFWVTGARTGA